MKNSVMAMVIGVLVAVPVMAEEAAEPAFRIAYEVSIADEDARERVGMYIRNELRNLGDVAVNDENPDYKLYVMVLEMNSERGNRLAYVLGISVTSYFPTGYFNSVLDDRLRNIQEVAARLEEEPNDPDGWVMLIRSYATLGKADDAREALLKANEVFQGNAAVLATLKTQTAGLVSTE